MIKFSCKDIKYERSQGMSAREILALYCILSNKPPHEFCPHSFVLGFQLLSPHILSQLQLILPQLLTDFKFQFESSLFSDYGLL